MRSTLLLFSSFTLAAHGIAEPRAASRVVTTPFHLRLLRSEPARDTTLNSGPATIKLWFSEDATAAISSITLTDPAGHGIALGRVRREGSDATVLVADVMGPLTPGPYVVKWRTASKDGHPVRGEYTFSVARRT